MNTTLCSDQHGLRTPKISLPHLAGQFARHVAARLGSALAHVMDQREKRRRIGSLRKLDERQLRDIGLTSGDVDYALSRPLAEDPSLVLQRLTQARRTAERAMMREARSGFRAERLRAAERASRNGNAADV